MLFNTENDIDLVGHFGGSCYSNEDTSRLVRDYDNTSYDDTAKYSFRNKEELISSRIFQECLQASLRFKDTQIRDLQNELLKYFPGIA